MLSDLNGVIDTVVPFYQRGDVMANMHKAILQELSRWDSATLSKRTPTSTPTSGKRSSGVIVLPTPLPTSVTAFLPTTVSTRPSARVLYDEDALLGGDDVGNEIVEGGSVVVRSSEASVKESRSRSKRGSVVRKDKPAAITTTTATSPQPSQSRLDMMAYYKAGGKAQKASSQQQQQQSTSLLTLAATAAALVKAKELKTVASSVLDVTSPIVITPTKPVNSGKSPATGVKQQPLTTSSPGTVPPKPRFMLSSDLQSKKL